MLSFYLRIEKGTGEYEKNERVQNKIATGVRLNVPMIGENEIWFWPEANFFFEFGI